MQNMVLIGCCHLDRNGVPKSRNFQKVMSLLETEKPSFVSQEVKLYNSLNTFIGEALCAPLKKIEAKILEEGSLGAEYEAGIIYCRRTETPLHWVDLYSATIEEVVQTDVIQEKPFRRLWDDHKEIPVRLTQLNPETGNPIYFDINERNRFMAYALSGLLKRHSPGSGSHIGGMGHYNPKVGLTIQSILNTCPVKPDRIKIIDIT